MDGFEFLPSRPDQLKRIDESFRGRILLRFHGGIGDVLMGVGGAVSGIHPSCHIAAGVLSWQVPLVSEIAGIDEVVDHQKSLSSSYECNFDAVIDMHLVNALEREAGILPSRDYYEIMSETLGVKASPAKFTFDHKPYGVFGRKVVTIHPSASTPNRRWINSKWDELVSRLVGSGYFVQWLGTADEYGFNASNVAKLSDIDKDLLWQAKMLAMSHYFIGCDSGFAHIAGMLGVTGAVIFTATRSRDVIAQYRSLRAVEVFDKLGVEPSRRLVVDDPDATKVKESITPSMVFQSLGINANDCIKISKRDARKYRIMIINKEGESARRIIEFLEKTYEIVEDSKNEPQITVTIENQIRETDNSQISCVGLYTDSGIVVHPNEHLPVVQQQIREWISI